MIPAAKAFFRELNFGGLRNRAARAALLNLASTVFNYAPRRISSAPAMNAAWTSGP